MLALRLMIYSKFALIRGVIVAVIAVALCSGGAAAQEAPASADALTAMIGNWEFSNADRDKVCRFVFRPDTAPGGYKVDIDRNCATLFPTTKDVAGWTLDSFGTLRLLDKAGNGVIELTEAENGIFDGLPARRGALCAAERGCGPTTNSRRIGRRLGDCTRHRQTGLLADAARTIPPAPTTCR